MNRNHSVVVNAAYRDANPRVGSPQTVTVRGITLAVPHHPMMMWAVWAQTREDIMMLIDLTDPMYPTLPQTIRLVAAEYIERTSLGV